MRTLLTLLPLPLLAACGVALNDPYPAADRGANILYSAFTERPKHLDPVQSYSENEIVFTAQIYEPPLQYHYLKRPYTVIPATAAVPKPIYLDAAERLLPQNIDASRIAYSDYIIALRPGIRYQPHPAFAKTPDGSFRYHEMSASDLDAKHVLADFTERDTRELSADDYVYEIKRLAHPHLHSPILGLMSEYIVGLGDLAKQLRAEKKNTEWMDLRKFELSGVKVIDRYHYRVRIKGKYPQFIYWLTMPFFAPIPWEADKFHSQPGMMDKNLTLDWYPIGTGPFMLTENDPNSRMVLERNPNFHGESFPCEGEVNDRAAGLLADCGKALPFIDKAIFTREKEQIPFWNKFLQGYYDFSGISSDSYDQAIQTSNGGEASLTDDMQKKGIQLSTSVETTTSYMGFNWLDPVTGGGTERARKIRQAISIAIDQEEFISIFLNGRGIAAQGPLPPGIFGYREGQDGINPEIYDWKEGKLQRKPVAEAKRLLVEAGFPDGRDVRTGEPLVINLDTTLSGVGAKSRVDWLTKQLRKIDVQMVVRSTDYNRFQEKLIKGNAQLFYFGWNADYPDPENFLFLLHGAQSKVKSQGENAANYSSPVFDKLFEQMRTMDNGTERQRVIDQIMVQIRHDAPWVWGFHPKDFALYHAWVFNRKPLRVGNNTLKYQRIDTGMREQKRQEWNRPSPWPIALLVLALAIAVIAYRRRQA